MKMIKKYKWSLLISSAVILLPILFGVIVWKKLPEQMAIHWGDTGQADGWASPMIAVFVLPLILLGAHWLCIFVTFLDNRYRDQSRRALRLALWILPVLSIYVNAMMYATAFGMRTDSNKLIAILMGVGLVIIGNYMPKFSRNRTMGVKIKWTLANDENWNKTHRFAGWLWVVCGFVVLISVFLPSVAIPYIMISVLFLVAIAPVIYSYCYYKKQIRQGTALKSDFKDNGKSTVFAIVISMIVVATVAVMLVICFTGDIRYHQGDGSFSVVASYYDDLSVNYEDVEKIEYREGGMTGERIYGFGTPRLLMGSFKNEELGNYTRYTYGGDRDCILLIVKGKPLVIGCYESEQTRALYEELLTNCKNIGG